MLSLRRIFDYKILTSLTGMLFLANLAMSQVSDSMKVVDFAKAPLSMKIRDYCLFFSDSTDQYVGRDIRQIPFSTRLSTMLGTKISPELVSHVAYLKFSVLNSADTATFCYVMPGLYFQAFDLFTLDSSGRYRQMPHSDKSEEHGMFGSFPLQPHETATVIARLKFVKTQVNYLDPRIAKGFFLPDLVNRIKSSANTTNMIAYLVCGILLMMIIYSLAVYWLNGSIEFIYYAGYAFAMAMLFFLKAFLYKEPTRFNYFFESYFDFIIQAGGIYSYLLFLCRFSESKKRFPVLHKVLVAEQVITIACVLLFTWLNFFSDNFVLQDKVETATKFLWTFVIVFFVIYSLVTRGQYLTYLAIGNLLLLIFSILSLYMIGSTTRFGRKIPPLLNDSLFYYEVGVTFELIFFLAALSFKNRKAIIERTLEQERLKLDNERKEFEKQMAVLAAKQDERNRISADMHDELGSGVTAIRLMSEIVKTKMKTETLPEIDKISSSANDLIGKMNTIIWTMKSSNDSVDNLVAYTRAYAIEYFENTGINCHVQIPEQIPTIELNGEKRRNIFLCVKEALNNVVKHSKASEVWINFQVDQSLCILIRDNGIGVNPAKMREFGNGLQNMKKRMEDIEGNFEMQNGVGLTTVLSVVI